jgi:telomere length regulation protein
MEGLLTPVSTSYRTLDDKGEDALVEASTSHDAISKPTFHVTTPAQALEILRSDPDYDTLILTLSYLENESSGFNVTSPGPLAAQLVHVLVSDTIPTYWNILQESQVGKKSKGGQQGIPRSHPNLELLLSCLRSVTGLNAILLSMKEHIQKLRHTKNSVGGPNIQDILAILLQVLKSLLNGDKIVEAISNSIWKSTDPSSKQKAVWDEFLGLVGSGKILSTAAEAEDAVNNLNKTIGERYWTADGLLYSSWLARNIAQWARTLPMDAEKAWNSCGELLSKSLRLGYTGKAAN